MLVLALADNRRVTYVGLGDNNVAAVGVECLIATLETNRTIVNLDLEDKDVRTGLVDEVELIFLAQERSMRNNDYTLTRFDCGGMEIGTQTTLCPCS